MIPPKVPRAARIPLLQALAFAAIGLPVHAINLAATVYLPHYYASHLGIGLAVVGSAFFLIRTIDIPVEALIGWGMDRTKTRFGRYRVWAVIGLPLFMAGTFFAFLPPEGAGRGYIILWMLVLYLGHSTLTLSQLAWGSMLAPGYDERSRLFAIIAAVGILGAALIIAIPIVNGALGAPDAANVPTMGWFIAGAAPITLALMLWATPEKRAPKSIGTAMGFRDYIAMLRRPAFARLLLADLAISLGVAWVGSIYLFFFTDSRGFTTAQASILLAVYILAGIAGAPAMGRLAVRISKHRTLILACIIYACALALLPLLPQGDFLLHGATLFICGFMAASFQATTRAMTADIADEIRLTLNQDRTALLYALTTMTNKVMAAVAVGLTFFLLSQVGYDAVSGATNSAEAIGGLNAVYLGGSILFIALGALCVIGYDLDADRHADIRRQLDERDAREAADAEAAAPLIVGP